ncbi:MFS transporter [Chloroflexota bacterium]
MNDSTSQRNFTGQGEIQGGNYLWVVLLLVTVAQLTQGLMRQGLPALYPFIQDEFGLSRAQVGLITSFLAAGSAIAVIFAGWLTDTFGVKRMITIAMLILAAFSLAFPLAYSFPLVLCLVIIIGIVGSPISLASTRAVIDWFPIRIRALAMSVKQMGIPIGGTLTAAVLPVLAVVTSWQMAAAVTGILVLVIAIAFTLLYREAPYVAQVEHKFSLTTLKEPCFGDNYHLGGYICRASVHRSELLYAVSDRRTWVFTDNSWRFAGNSPG